MESALNGVGQANGQGVGGWEGAEVIFSYTRAEALEDGVLVDISEWAREYGIVYPVAVTAELWGGYIDDPTGMNCAGQSAKGRGLDVVAMLKLYIKKSREGESIINFPVIFATGISQTGNEKRRKTNLKAVCGPGDNMEPVITIMMPWED